MAPFLSIPRVVLDFKLFGSVPIIPGVFSTNMWLKGNFLLLKVEFINEHSYTKFDNSNNIKVSAKANIRMLDVLF